MSELNWNQMLVKRAKELIQKSGLKKKTIAERAGYSKEELADILHGRREIKASDVPRIAKGLRIQPNELFSPRENGERTKEL